MRKIRTGEGRMKRIIVICLLLKIWCCAFAVEKMPAAEASSLIAALDSDDFDVRCRATDELISRGSYWLSRIVRLAASPKAGTEVRQRARYIAERLEWKRLNGGGPVIDGLQLALRAIQKESCGGDILLLKFQLRNRTKQAFVYKHPTAIDLRVENKAFAAPPQIEDGTIAWADLRPLSGQTVEMTEATLDKAHFSTVTSDLAPKQSAWRTMDFDLDGAVTREKGGSHQNLDYEISASLAEGGYELKIVMEVQNNKTRASTTLTSNIVRFTVKYDRPGAALVEIAK
jgi:hypothetical protein